MDLATGYLLHTLEDRFGSNPSARIRVVQPAVTQRAVDLPQDYDPEQSNLHRRRGVSLRIRGREFFFEASLVELKQFAVIEELAREAETWAEALN